MKRGLRLFLLRWHRRLGVAAALVVIMLVLTGIALNHSSDMALDEKPVESPLLLKRYGVELPEVMTYPVGERYLTLVAGSRLYLNTREIAYCEGPLSAALAYGDGLVALCSDQLLLLTAKGDVVERLSTAYGLPEDISAMGLAGEQLWLKTAEQSFLADLHSLVFTPGAPPADTRWANAVATPPALQETLVRNFLGSDVHWERLLLDLHSGRLFGTFGVYLVDLSAIILLLLALSGAWVWLTKPGRWRR